MSVLTERDKVRLNPSGVPWGVGSLQIRGRVYWMIYRDLAGRVIQENTLTANLEEARVVLAERAIEVSEARIVALKAVRDAAADDNAAAVQAATRRTHEAKTKSQRSPSTRARTDRASADSGPAAAVSDRKARAGKRGKQ